MIPKECKRLAEADFPIAIVSSHSIRDTSIRQAHPRALHLWWARRPLAACRAVLLSLLLPDPCDPHCPIAFKQAALKLLRRGPETDDKVLQKALLKFIGEFSSWDASTDRKYLEISRGLVKAANPGEMPLVLDPFSGGGSIPLEALRIGCDAFASDLNPVACLIEKALLEDIPRSDHDLSAAIRKLGKTIQAESEIVLEKYYPFDEDGSRPVAYIWARTVVCEAPNCGAEIPLVRSFWLSKKAGRKFAVKYIVGRTGKIPTIDFEIIKPRKDKDVPEATVFQANATCPACKNVLSASRVRAQLIEKHGGIENIRLLAVVTQKENSTEKNYRSPSKSDLLGLNYSKKKYAELTRRTSQNGLSLIPDEEIPRTELRRVSAPLYGCDNWIDLFTIRQRVALHVVIEKIRDAISTHENKSISALLALTFGKIVRHWNSNARWHNGSESIAGAFGRQAIPMAWSFPEQTPWNNGAGSISDAIENVADAIDMIQRSVQNAGQVTMADASNVPLPSDSVNVWFTDPPYYDAVAYAHLADFFYIWIKRIIPENAMFGSTTIIKDNECVVDRPHSLSSSIKDREWFEHKITTAMSEGRRLLHPDGIGCVVFAHKTTEGWEALISGMLKSGWVITASWPISTERGARLNARDNASLATSVHLVCRPRIEHEVGDWGEVLRELPRRVGDWIEKLQAEHVRGADLVFACIGPALEIFSRYSRVETAEGKEVPLAEYLAKVWEVVGRTALEQVLGTAEAVARNGMAGALEEDARLTALFLWTLQSTNGDGAEGKDADEEEGDEGEEDAGAKGKKGGYSLIYDVARRFAQPLGIHLDKWEGRIIETTKGVVRLLPVHERAKQLFGEEGVHAVAEQMKHKRAESLQMTLFAHAELPSADEQAKLGRKKKTRIEISDDAVEARKIDATTLDRVHAAMLLQAGGQSNALRALLKAEQERGPDFLRLANSLTALYPQGSEERRLLEAMLHAMPR